MTAERSVSRISSRHYSDHSRRVVESSPEPQASTSSTVVAGVDAEPSVSKMLKKTEKKKKVWKS